MSRIEIDPITLAVLEGSLQSAIREMRHVLVRSGRSPIIAISTDFSNSILDAAGEQVVQGDDQPVHLGSMQVALKQTIRFFGDDLAEGDVIYVNDPTYGGGHQADMTMFKPVFIDGELFAWVGNRAHVSDSGGPVAGGYNPLAREIYAEGIRMSPIKIYERGKVRRDVVTMLLLNLRTPDAHRGDMGAQMGALGVAERRIRELYGSLGAERLRAGFSALLDRGEELARRAISEIADGTYRGHSAMEDPRGGPPLDIHCAIGVDGDQILVKLGGSPQINRYFNSYFGNSISAIYAGMLTVFPTSIPHNGGVYRCIDIDLGEKGTIVNAVEPSPSSMATSTPFDNIMEAVEAALAEAVPERAVAGWSHFCGSTFGGLDTRTGERFSHLSTMSGIGGAGAMWETDGWSCCSPQCTFGGMRTGNVEEIEFRIPMRINSRKALTRSMLDLMAPYDAMLSPGYPCLAAPVETTMASVNGKEMDFIGLARNLTGVQNFLGFPGLMVPTGLDSAHGLPMAIQITTRPGDEARGFRVGHAFEQATPEWRTRKPAL